MKKSWDARRKRVFEILEVGYNYDFISRSYDYINTFAIILNLVASVLFTYDEIRVQYGFLIVLVEEITVAFFGIDYLLRIWTAKFLHPKDSEIRAIGKYVFSFTGIVDMLSFVPYYLPVFFPTGTVAFRMIRIARIFRLFRINAYYDSLHVITEVLNGKRQQLVSSVFIILILMMASSLCMYSLEHGAQPDVFKNAFSGIWWAASTLLTVGYGDIYPITTLGKVFGIFISFLGVGMVAIPTGIISAGFVDQYSSIKRKAEFGTEEDLNFIKIHLHDRDKWVGKSIAELNLPANVIIAMIKREDAKIIPRGNVVLQTGDIIVMGAEAFSNQEQIKLKEMVLQKQNPWIGERIRDLDISRHSIIVLIKRHGKTMIPYGNLILKEGDIVFMYTQLHMSSAKDIEV